MVGGLEWWPYVYYASWVSMLVCSSLMINKLNSCTKKERVEDDGVELDHMLPSTHSSRDSDFAAFQRNYLTVFLIMMAADWFQGPYMYALYDYYGYNIEQIGTLFLMGFGASLVSGPIVGATADKFGRKKMCIAFAVLYAAACITKHVNHYGILMFGRILSGIATSILYSSFEAWMIKEHQLLNFSNEQLESTFSMATSGNGIIAIIVGIIAAIANDYDGPTAPIKCSFVLLVIGGIIIQFKWRENYGDQSSAISSGMKDGFKVVLTDKNVAMIGFMQSFFESAMYTFVFMWTPALTNTTPFKALLGWVFSAFMIAITLGSNVFQLFSSRNKSVEFSIGVAFLFGAVSLIIPAFVENHGVRMAAFVLFEACCGLYFPSIGILRAKYVPEAQRSTIMTIFRVPLNFVVALILSNLESLSERAVFLLCGLCLCLAFLCKEQISPASPSKVQDGDVGEMMKSVTA